jgi:hypothetical protein
MNDWLKVAKEKQLDDYLDTFKKVEEKRQRTEELREAEKNWMDRVERRAEEINAEGFFIHVHKKNSTLRLVNKGEVEIELTERDCFSITYKNILPPTTLLLRSPMLVHHHRVVKVRELNAHNIEEVMKFVVLGMKKYTQIASRTRIEHNLQEMLYIEKKDVREVTGR